MLEALQQTRAAAADEPGVQAIAEAMYVEERQGQKKTVGARDLPAGEQIERVRGNVVVREDGALGHAGGAGGVDDAGGGIAVQKNLRAFVGQNGGVAREIRRMPEGHGAGKLSCGDHSRRLGIAEDMRQLALAIEDVDGNEDHAQLEAGEIQVDHLEAIGEVNAQAIARFKLAPGQQLSQAIAAGVDIAESVGGSLEFERGLAAASMEGKIEEVKEIQKVKIPWRGRR